jgi:hypothetical protein
MGDQRYKLYFASAFTLDIGFWVRHNSRLNKALPPKVELITMHITSQDRFISVDLKLFREPYYKKFVEPNVERYCLGFLRAIEGRVIHILSCEMEPYTIRYEFYYHGGVIKKYVTYSFGSMIS